MATQCLTRDITAWIGRLAFLLDARLSWRLLPLLTGLLFATGRRTVSSWLRAGQLSNEYQDYYYFLYALGRKVELLAGALLRIAVDVLVPQGRVLLEQLLLLGPLHFLGGLENLALLLGEILLQRVIPLLGRLRFLPAPWFGHASHCRQRQHDEEQSAYDAPHGGTSSFKHGRTAAASTAAPHTVALNSVL